VTTAEKVQKIRVAVDRTLCYLRVGVPLWQLFGDEHAGKLYYPHSAYAPSFTALTLIP
jgi:hypothetical protein